MATAGKNPTTAGTAGENPTAAATKVSEDIPPEYYEAIAGFFNHVGAAKPIKPQHDVKDSFSNLVGGVLKVISIERGKISCLLNVKAPILNGYGGMHGGAVGAVAERVAIACARTVVGEDKDLFLGELSVSYLSAAPHNAEVVIDGNVVRSGRNLTVVAVNFRLKESGRLAFMTRATFYNMPVSSL
ncbi:HGG motif-containing thioesterase [Handroanthus impetiginosus]|uniref:HGG motif-containing thioesterase n=1 Tax=Handroanthus impetiginosus TaxID=429701 RepID=A0A2G9GAM6_9LAMI|nr:HGG motif-containing thioesterase [Handroanthus impetiginosus]